MHVPGMLVRRDVFVAHGGFNPSLRTGEDTDLIARLRGAAEREARLAETLGATRLHGGNLSNDRVQVGRAHARSLHAALRARRARAEASGISALVCVRNGEAYLAEALESILAQTAAACEVIVVDDGSSDRSAAIARGFAPQVTLISTPPLGIGAARQRALDASRGAFIAFLDADDRWSPDYLHHHRARLAADPSGDASRAQVQPFISPELDAGAVAPTAANLSNRPGMLVAAMVIRRAAALRVGAFDPNSTFPDQDWLMRAIDAEVRFTDTPEALLHRRIHTRNYTLTVGRDFHGRLTALKRGLDRRRAGDAAAARSEDAE
jgi:glycosyltransferase involved in cell wall biosynthesis